MSEPASYEIQGKTVELPAVVRDASAGPRGRGSVRSSMRQTRAKIGNAAAHTNPSLIDENTCCGVNTGSTADVAFADEYDAKPSNSDRANIWKK